MGNANISFKWVNTTGNGPAIGGLVTDVLVVPVEQQAKGKGKESSGKGKKQSKGDAATLVWSKVLSELDKALGGQLKPLLAAEEFTGKAKAVWAMPVRKGDALKARWVLLVGLGQADKAAREQGKDMIGIYHSHPDCDAYFSQTDLKNSCPWYSFVVLSIK